MKIVIIGGGPAGYSAALEASRRNLDVTLVERDKLGGVCLNYGCIPTKSILSSCDLIDKIREGGKFAINANCSFNYKDILKRKDIIVENLRKNLKAVIMSKKINLVSGEAKIIGGKKIDINGVKFDFDFIIISTGSRQKDVGVIGIYPEKVFLSSYSIESEKEINILGGGISGCEFATIFSSLGFKVNLFEKGSKILPSLEEDVREIIEKKLESKHVNIIKNYLIEDKKEFIICTGREANLPESEIELKTKDGFLEVDENLKTNIENIYAIGDVNGNCLLAYWAMAEGRKVIKSILGESEKLDIMSIPNVIFTRPEISFFGKIIPEYKSIKSAEEGFVKLFFDSEKKLRAGIIVGKHSCEIINQLAFHKGKNLNELKNNLFFHPSFSETIGDILRDFED